MGSGDSKGVQQPFYGGQPIEDMLRNIEETVGAVSQMQFLSQQEPDKNRLAKDNITKLLRSVELAMPEENRLLKTQRVAFLAYSAESFQKIVTFKNTELRKIFFEKFDRIAHEAIYAKNFSLGHVFQKQNEDIQALKYTLKKILPEEFREDIVKEHIELYDFLQEQISMVFENKKMLFLNEINSVQLNIKDKIGMVLGNKYLSEVAEPELKQIAYHYELCTFLVYSALFLEIVREENEIARGEMNVTTLEFPLGKDPEKPFVDEDLTAKPQSFN